MVAIFTLRTYCIYECNIWIASVVGILALGDVAMKIVHMLALSMLMKDETDKISNSFARRGQCLSFYRIASEVAIQ